MYIRYCGSQGYEVEEIYKSTSDVGIVEAIFRVNGEGAYENLVVEAGGHRVQRVPPTEKDGRRQTSTATVAVLKDEELADIEITEDDVEFQATRGSGKGGQHRNKTSTAVRLTHKKTGKAVFAQDNKSQSINRKNALERLRSGIVSDLRADLKHRINRLRRKQIGMGLRGGKVRTYNFARGVITDHRTGKSTRDVKKFMSGQLELLR